MPLILIFISQFNNRSPAPQYINIQQVKCYKYRERTTWPCSTAVTSIRHPSCSRSASHSKKVVSKTEIRIKIKIKIEIGIETMKINRRSILISVLRISIRFAFISRISLLISGNRTFLISKCRPMRSLHSAIFPSPYRPSSSSTKTPSTGT